MTYQSLKNIDKIIIHCSDSTWGSADEIRKWHLARGFDDVGYHLIIQNGHPQGSTEFSEAHDGLLQPGRPLNVQGAHCRAGGGNSNSIGICMIGKTEFTDKQWNTLWEVVNTYRHQFLISNMAIYGHRDLDSHKTCPNFDVQEWFQGKIGARTINSLNGRILGPI